MPDPVTNPPSSAALTPHAPPPSRLPKPEWEPKKFPGVDGEKQLTTAFWIVNEWAKELQEWLYKSAAMSAITQVALNMTSEDPIFEEVVQEMKGGHKFDKVKQVLDQKNNRHAAVLGFPTDVLGHPPGPPFDDTLKDP